MKKNRCNKDHTAITWEGIGVPCPVCEWTENKCDKDHHAVTWEGITVPCPVCMMREDLADCGYSVAGNLRKQIKSLRDRLENAELLCRTYRSDGLP